MNISSTYIPKRGKSSFQYRKYKADEEFNKESISLDNLMGILKDISKESFLQSKISEINLLKNDVKLTKAKILKMLGSNRSENETFVWLKFRKDKNGNLYVGVVAYGKDFNFFKKNTSGRLITNLGLEWDVKKMIVIKFKSDVSIKDKKLAETKIGDLLIEKNIPILDFYSHRY